MSNIIAFQHLSCQDTIIASKDGVDCLSYLIQLAEQSVPTYGNIEHEQVNMFQSSLLNVVNDQYIQSNFIDLTDFQILFLFYSAK